MKGTKWSPEEKALLKTDLTAEEIAARTGRTSEAVRRARYTYTGHFVEKSKALKTKEDKLFEMEYRCRKLKREEDLIKLCKTLGVRIGGMYEYR